MIGSVRAITDEAGAVVIRHDYAPFGEDKDPDMTGDPMRFAGKELDPETGMNYFAARYYRNTWGRFTSVDPVSGWPSDPQSWNRYAYARNNPLKYVDPSGLWYQATAAIGNNLWHQFHGKDADFYEWLRMWNLRIPARESTGTIYDWLGQNVGQYSWEGPDETTEPSTSPFPPFPSPEPPPGPDPDPDPVPPCPVPSACPAPPPPPPPPPGPDPDPDPPCTADCDPVDPGKGPGLKAACGAMSPEWRNCAAAWFTANPDAVKLGIMPGPPGRVISSLLGRAGEFLFARGGRGLLNGRVTGDLFRVGYSWTGSAKTGSEVFRIAIGSKRSTIHWHLDLWKR